VNKIVRFVATALIMVFASGNSVLADNNIVNSISTLQNQNTSTQNQSSSSQNQTVNSQNISTGAQVQALNGQIEILDSQIEDTLRKIDDNKNEINKTQNDIKNLESQISYTENDIKNHKQLLNDRVRAIYMSGTDSYLDVILNSKSFQGFISKLVIIKKIIKLDQSTINDLSDKRNSIIVQKENLKTKNDSLQKLLSDNQQKLDTLNKDKDNESKLLTKLQEQEKAYALSNSSNTNASSQQVIPASNNPIINYAFTFLGTPYLWGGTTPQGFDCSGFIQYVYAHFGIKVDRTTYQQIKDGVEVPKGKIQPGDLLLFGTAEDPHHIGMYIGNGMYIHAPHTGDVVKISSLNNRNDLLTARRVE
jgi:cell wall-associated NlpC family hydrolase